QQVTVGGLNIEDGDLGLGPRLLDDLEELALAVGLHIQGDEARRAAAASGVGSHLQPCADACKLDVEEVRVHREGDTASEGRVRSEVVSKITVGRLATSNDEGTSQRQGETHPALPDMEDAQDGQDRMSSSLFHGDEVKE